MRRALVEIDIDRTVRGVINLSSRGGKCACLWRVATTVARHRLATDLERTSRLFIWLYSEEPACVCSCFALFCVLLCAGAGIVLHPVRGIPFLAATKAMVGMFRDIIHLRSA